MRAPWFLAEGLGGRETFTATWEILGSWNVEVCFMWRPRGCDKVPNENRKMGLSKRREEREKEEETKL